MDQWWYKGFNLVYQPPLLIMLRLLSCLINLRQQSIKYTRIDIVYDVYYKISIKNATREKHGRGFRYTVTGQGKIPKDWKAFLNISENKIELFAFLTDVVTHMLTCPILVHLIMRRHTLGCSSICQVQRCHQTRTHQCYDLDCWQRCSGITISYKILYSW